MVSRERADARADKERSAIGMRKNYIYAGVLAAIVVIMAGRYYGNKLGGGLPGNLSEWQAVFLSDGQVYFGHLKTYNSNFYLLTNIYYLKYGNALQQNAGASDVAVSEQKLNLIKLGGELHGPEDMMYIAKDKIIFIENLKSTSLVVKAISKTN